MSSVGSFHEKIVWSTRDFPEKERVEIWRDADFVRAARLERARRLLADPQFASHRIASIAYEAGFSDLSYFNRCFRHRYGLTPSDFRASVRQDDQRRDLPDA